MTATPVKGPGQWILTPAARIDRVKPEQWILSRKFLFFFFFFVCMRVWAVFQLVGVGLRLSGSDWVNSKWVG